MWALPWSTSKPETENKVARRTIYHISPILPITLKIFHIRVSLFVDWIVYSKWVSSFFLANCQISSLKTKSGVWFSILVIDTVIQATRQDSVSPTPPKLFLIMQSLVAGQGSKWCYMEYTDHTLHRGCILHEQQHSPVIPSQPVLGQTSHSWHRSSGLVGLVQHSTELTGVSTFSFSPFSVVSSSFLIISFSPRVIVLTWQSYWHWRHW